VAGVFGGDVIEVGTGHPWWRARTKRHERVKVVVHECFHVLQHELGGLRGAPEDQVRPDRPSVAP
jgi:predicted metallopeptidase